MIVIVVHVLVDRNPQRRTGHRIIELCLLGACLRGVWRSWPPLAISVRNSGSTAESIGYAPRCSSGKWDGGRCDRVLGIGCAWKSRRDGWLTAAVVVLAICYWGDAIGHVMQYVAHDNNATNNVWAIPSDIPRTARGGGAADYLSPGSAPTGASYRATRRHVHGPTS